MNRRSRWPVFVAGCQGPAEIAPSTGRASQRRARPAGALRSRATAVTLAICTACVTGCPEPEAPSPMERSRARAVRRPDGAVGIENFGPIAGFARGRDCTFIHCLELVLEVRGRPIGYDELMGLSGAAFRIQFRVDCWDAGNSDPLVGESLLEPLFAAIGWGFDLRLVRPDEPAERDALRRAIRESIGRQMPVLAANLIPPEDWGIITGYRDDFTWLCRAYNGGAEQTDKPATSWPTAVVLLSEVRPRPTGPQVFIDSLRRAVELWDRRASGPYALGRKAFDHWCQALLAAREPDYVHPNFWTYVSLIDARGAAVRYLRGLPKHLPTKEKDLLMAADWYEREVHMLLKGMDHVPPARQYRDTLPPADLRRKQLDVLREAQGLEERAIEAIRQAL